MLLECCWSQNMTSGGPSSHFVPLVATYDNFMAGMVPRRAADVSDELEHTRQNLMTPSGSQWELVAASGS